MSDKDRLLSVKEVVYDPSTGVTYNSTKPIGGPIDNFSNDGSENAVRDDLSWQLGANGGTVASYFRLFVMTLLSSFIWYFFAFSMRGLVGSVLVLMLGTFITRWGLSNVFYGETRGVLTPIQSAIAMWAGSVHYGYGILMMLTAIGASFLASVAVFYIPTSVNAGGAVINPLANPVLDAFSGGNLIFVETIFLTFAYFTFGVSYGWRNYWTGLSSNPNVVRGAPTTPKLFMAYDFHDPSSIHSAIFAVGHGVLYPLTGGALDFFGFFSPAIVSGLITDYPLWYGYFVSDVISFIIACLLCTAAKYLMNRDNKGIGRESIKTA